MKGSEVLRIVDNMHRVGFKWISGKWYRGDSEIYNIERYLYKAYHPSICTRTDLDSVTQTFMGVYGDPDGAWLDTSVVRDAKKLLEGSESLPELPVALDKKQLMIINRVLQDKDEHMYIVTGRGGTGKSTFINIVKQLFDDNDVVTLDLDDMANSFTMAMAAGKRFITSEELGDTVERNSKLKKLISRENISLNPKFGRTMEIKMRASFLFACNVPPKFDLSDNNGMGRRVIYYRMNKPIASPDINVKDKVLTHEESVIIAAHALRMDMSDWEKEFEQESHECLCETNSVYLYSNREFTDDSDSSFGEYRDKCRECCNTPQSKERWKRTKDLIMSWGMWHV